LSVKIRAQKAAGKLFSNNYLIEPQI
jgi:hypothetical protein